jgi:hypothetical protein
MVVEPLGVIATVGSGLTVKLTELEVLWPQVF